jgi:xanthosine utilization system XapX-like protein
VAPPTTNDTAPKVPDDPEFYVLLPSSVVSAAAFVYLSYVPLGWSWSFAVVVAFGWYLGVAAVSMISKVLAQGIFRLTWFRASIVGGMLGAIASPVVGTLALGAPLLSLLAIAAGIIGLAVACAFARSQWPEA